MVAAENWVYNPEHTLTERGPAMKLLFPVLAAAMLLAYATVSYAQSFVVQGISATVQEALNGHPASPQPQTDNTKKN